VYRYSREQAAFVAKLSDAESEACEAQTWIEFALRCSYLASERATDLDAQPARQWRAANA
jgi:four helix bundle protein